MYTVFCDNILLIIAVNSMRIHERHIVIEPNQKSLDFLAKPKQKKSVFGKLAFANVAFETQFHSVRHWPVSRIARKAFLMSARENTSCTAQHFRSMSSERYIKCISVAQYDSNDIGKTYFPLRDRMGYFSDGNQRIRRKERNANTRWTLIYRNI